jgi:hypothetical protein
MIRKLLFVVAAALLVSVPASAQAYWPYYGYGGFGGGPWGYGYNYGTGYVPAPPYFSVFPPVYYSHQITARPYGASPYAWPAGFSPIVYRDEYYEAAPPAEPLMIENPYVKGAAVPTAVDSLQVKAIANPYVSQR